MTDAKKLVLNPSTCTDDNITLELVDTLQAQCINTLQKFTLDNNITDRLTEYYIQQEVTQSTQQVDDTQSEGST